MATSLSARMPIPADPAAAYALLTDPAYVQAVGEAHRRPGGRRHRDAHRRRRRGRGLAPRAAGRAAVVREGRGGRQPEADRDPHLRSGGGGRQPYGDGRGSLRRRPGVDQGPAAARRDRLRERARPRREVSASIPFVGGKIEKFAAEQIERFMRKEAEIAADRLIG